MQNKDFVTLFNLSERLDQLFHELSDATILLSEFEKFLKEKEFEQKDLVLKNFNRLNKWYGYIFEDVSQASQSHQNIVAQLYRNVVFKVSLDAELIRIKDENETIDALLNQLKGQYTKEILVLLFAATMFQVNDILNRIKPVLRMGDVLFQMPKDEKVVRQYHEVFDKLQTAISIHNGLSGGLDLFAAEKKELTPVEQKFDNTLANAMYALCYNTEHRLFFAKEFAAKGEYIVRRISPVFKFNTSVTEVDLTGMQFGVKGAQALQWGLTRNSTVRTLKLDDCGLDDESGGVIAGIFSWKSQSQIATFSITNNKLSSVAAIAFSNALLTSTFTTFSISFAKDGEKAVQDLKIGIMMNRKLIQFRIAGASVTQSDWAEISSKLERNREAARNR